MARAALRVAVVGAGGIAHSVHLPALREIARADLVSVCDLDRDRARAAAERFGIPAFCTDYRDMLEAARPGAALVLVQPDQAFRVARDCLRSGCPVLVEKPPGVTAYQAQTLARAAREAGALCQVGFNRRFIPLVREVVGRLRALAPIHQIDGWFYKNGDAAFYDGSAPASLCDAIHTIDLVRHIAGAEPAQLAQLAARHGGSPVDNAWNGLIGFENGICGTVHANYQTGGRVHGLAVHTSLASAYIDLGFGAEACSARILHHREGTVSLSSRGAGRQEIEHVDGMQVAGSRAYHRYYGYYDQDAAFVRAVLEGAPSPCDIEDALGSMRLAEGLHAVERRIVKE
ncbi:MAG: Gfo/Idh/MocA family oxidoreductase [Clostridia bacterium]|nr:Gfo/Idh/MocA family oxidoreductase [Clostridia bacterium]